MKVIFKQSGEGLGIGKFNKGDTKNVPDHIAKLYVKRGVAVEVKDHKPLKPTKKRWEGK